MKTQKEIFAWLKENCGKHCLGGLTSTDTYALVTSVGLSNLIGYDTAPEELFAAYHAIISAMQPQMRWLAYHAIAMELDWGHRAMIWRMADLPAADKPTYECKWGPAGLRAKEVAA